MNCNKQKNTALEFLAGVFLHMVIITKKHCAKFEAI